MYWETQRANYFGGKSLFSRYSVQYYKLYSYLKSLLIVKSRLIETELVESQWIIDRNLNAKPTLQIEILKKNLNILEEVKRVIST